MPELRIGADTIYIRRIHIGGSALLYQLDEPVGMIGWPVHASIAPLAIRASIWKLRAPQTSCARRALVCGYSCSGAVRLHKSCRAAAKSPSFLKSLRVAAARPQRSLSVITPIRSNGREASASFTLPQPWRLLPAPALATQGGFAD